MPVEAQATVVKAEFLRAAQRHAHDAVLEGERGIIDGVVLDPEFADAQPFGQAVRFDQRREADLEADSGSPATGSNSR